jgi:hypothetical protein
LAAQANAEAGSIRSAIRWGLFLATVATFGFRLMPLMRDFRAWRMAVRLGGPSEAEGLRTYLLADAVSLLIVLGLGLSLFYFLRPRSKGQA